VRAAEVGRHVHGTRLTDADFVEVQVGLDEGSPAEPVRSERPRSPRWYAVLAGAALVGLAALLLVPDRPARLAAEPGGPVALAAWPPRGAWAEDADALREVAEAWRAAGAGIPAPGRDVEPLYLGEPDGSAVALVRSIDDAGRLHVATAQRGASGWRLLTAATVTTDVSWLTVPGTDVVRVLPDPAVVDDAALLVRRSDGVWTRAPVHDDDLVVVPGTSGPAAVMGVARRDGAVLSLDDVATVVPAEVLPAPPPVRLRDPAWGRSQPVTVEEFDAAIYAATALPDADNGLAVLATTRTPRGRLVLVESPTTVQGWTRQLFVIPDADGSAQLGALPQMGDDVAIGLAPRGEGRAAVLVATSPRVARVEVRSSQGDLVVEGTGTTAVVLPSPAPDRLEVQARSGDGAVVEGLSVSVAEALSTASGIG
jgi:hypothetical protein